MTIVGATRIGVERPVVIGPAIARPVWQKRWPIWGPASVKPWVISYDELVRRGDMVWRDLLAYEPDLLVLDEVHRCSTTTAKRSKLALKLANRVERVWVLSGSPVRNGPQDLYPVLRAIWPDELRKLGIKDRWDYLRMFSDFIPGEYGPKVLRAKNVPILKEILGRIMLRPSDDEVNLDLPSLRWEAMPLESTFAGNVDLEILRAVGLSREDFAHLLADDDATQQHVASIRRCLGTVKAVAVAAALRDELDDGLLNKVVVFAHHRDVLDTLHGGLLKYGVARIDGSTSGLARQEHQESFQNDPRCRVFLGQTQACGEVIDLFAAHECVFVEPSWTPEDDVQAAKRLHRIGQTRPVRARVCVLEGTLDDPIARVRDRKLTMAGEIVHS